MKRIHEIEGLRAVLACWVMLAHCMGASGIEPHEVEGLFKIVRNAGYAVDVFVIISGFVIALLLDRGREHYAVFLGRRWFRLFPLYAICMLAGAALVQIQSNNLHYAAAWLSPERALGEAGILNAISSHPWPYAILSLFMLQGAVPEFILPAAPVAFLGTAWSISLEWQFYLIAPLLVFPLLTLKVSKQTIIITTIACVAYIAAILRIIPFVSLGAFLPFHIEFFYLGIISYAFISTYVKRLGEVQPPWTLYSVALTIFLLPLVKAGPILPYLIWLNIMAMLLESHQDKRSLTASVMSYSLNNALFQFLGAISYGIYLVHYLVIVMAQGFLFRFYPTLSQQMHLVMLLITVPVFTFGISYFLHVFVENPCNAFAKKKVAYRSS